MLVGGQGDISFLVQNNLRMFVSTPRLELSFCLLDSSFVPTGNFDLRKGELVISSGAPRTRRPS